MEDFQKIAKEVLRIEATALLEAKLDSIDWDGIVSCILQSKGKVILTGVGKSGLIARKISATFSSTGTPSFFMHPAEAIHGDLGMVGREDVVIAISYSGESEELLRLIPHLKSLCQAIITMSKSKDSSLSKLGDFFIPIAIKREACNLNIAPTTSTTLTLALGDALAICLMKARKFNQADFASLHPGGSLGRRLFIKIKDLMQTQNLPILDPATPLKEAILVMSQGRLGSAILLEKGKLKGIFSDGDLRRAMMREDFSFDKPIDTYATKSPKICKDPEMLAYNALRFIQKNQIQILLILNDEDELLGAVHLHTLISAGIVL